MLLTRVGKQITEGVSSIQKLFGVDKERSSVFRCQLSLLQKIVVQCCEKARSIAAGLSCSSEGLFESLLGLRRYL